MKEPMAMVVYCRDNKVETVVCVSKLSVAQSSFLDEVKKLGLIGFEPGKVWKTASEVISDLTDDSQLTVQVNDELNLQIIIN
jgi:hypothetical protein